jgi:hypothetical protein
MSKEVKKKIIKVEYWPLGTMVYVRHDPEQVARMITGVTIREQDLQYHLSSIDGIDVYYEYEFSTEKNIFI